MSYVSHFPQKALSLLVCSSHVWSREKEEKHTRKKTPRVRAKPRPRRDNYGCILSPPSRTLPLLFVGLSLECDVWVLCNDFPERFKEIEELSLVISHLYQDFRFLDCYLYVFVLLLPE